MKGLGRWFCLMALCLTIAGGCGKKAAAPAEEPRPAGPERLKVDTEFLREALGEEDGGGASHLSREEILRRREQRERARQAALARKKQEEQRATATQAQAATPRSPSGDPQHGKLEELCKRCGFYLNEGQNEQALEQARQLAKERPTAPDAQVVLGVVYRRRGEIDKAVERYEAALKLDPTHEWAMANLGLAYRYQGRFVEAAERYEAFLKANPRATLIHYNAGVLYELYIGDKARSLGRYVQYLRAGGDRQEEVNAWVTVLANDLGLERPPTPGYVAPSEGSPSEEPPEETVEAAGAVAAQNGESAVEEKAGPTVAGAAVTGGAGAAPGAATSSAAASAVAASAGTAESAAAEVGAQGGSAGAVAAVAASTDSSPPLVLYPFVVAKGEVDPVVLEQISAIFSKTLARGTSLLSAEALSEAERAKGLSGQCESAKCQLRIAFSVGAAGLVHGEIATPPSKLAWYVIVDIYDLKARKKARLKLKANVADGTDAFYKRIAAMARAVAKRVGS